MSAAVLTAIALTCLLGICVAVGGKGREFEAPQPPRSPRQYRGR